jgi:hypothetical protein
VGDDQSPNQPDAEAVEPLSPHSKTRHSKPDARNQHHTLHPPLILLLPLGELPGKRGVAEGSIPQVLSAPLPKERENSAILTNRFDWTNGHCFLASRALRFIFRLLADIGIRVLERAREVPGTSVAADIAIDAGGVDIERAVNVLFNFVVSIGHESAAYADFTD